MNKQKKTNLFVTIVVMIVVIVSLSSIRYFPKKKMKIKKDTIDINKAFKCKNWK